MCCKNVAACMVFVRDCVMCPQLMCARGRGAWRADVHALRDAGVHRAGGSAGCVGRLHPAWQGSSLLVDVCGAFALVVCGLVGCRRRSVLEGVRELDSGEEGCALLCCGVCGFEVLLNKGHGKPVDWWTLGLEGGRWPLVGRQEAVAPGVDV